jgi:IS4 transposase
LRILVPMSNLRAFTEEWEFLLAALPSVDLEKSLRESGGYRRRRAVRSAETLLRLALVYGFCGLSLRQTAAWADAQEVAKLSDVALLKRLRSCSDWLSHLLGAKLAERAQMVPRPDSSLRLRLMDATSIAVPGRKGTGWRVHVGFGLNQLVIDHIDLTGSEGGETFCRFPLRREDLVLGDRGYAHRRGLAAVCQAGGNFLIRLNWSNVPLQDLEGKSFDLFKALRQIPGLQVAEYRVQTAPQASEKIAALPARLIAVRKSPAAAEKERQKILREAAKKKRKADPRSLEAAEYTIVLTSMGEEQLPAAEALELYRFRWQIEMAFKRLKGLLGLGHLSAKDSHLARSALYAKLLAALLLEDLTGKFLSFSPWGFPLPGPPAESVANPPSAARCDGPCDFGCPDTPRVDPESLSTVPLLL